MTGETDRGIADIVRRLRDDSTLLFRQEITLAKVELQEKAARVGRNAAYVATGALVAYAGLLFLLLAITAGLELALIEAGLEVAAHWLAPLIVGLIVALLGYSFVHSGINTLKEESLAPEKTIESLKEDKEWLQRKAT